MPVDKFGRHISKYYFDRLQETLDLSYEIILTFRGYGATSPIDAGYAYTLEHGALTYVFPLKTAIIDRVTHFSPYDTIVYINGDAIEIQKLTSRILKQNDSLMFVASKKAKTGKMSVELVLKCLVLK